MNHRGGLALIKSTWSSWMQHRGFFFLVAFLWMIPPLIYLFVWSTAASGQTIGGLSRGELVAYYLVMIVVAKFTFSGNNWIVGDLIRQGNMSTLLLRPLSPLYHTLADEIASKVVMMVFVIPVSGGLALVLKPTLHVSLQAGLACLPALALAWALRFFWEYWIALLAFWSTQSNALLALQGSLIFLLAGQVAPLALLPKALQTAAVILPFRYMVSFPVEVLTGQLNADELRLGFVLQLGWLAITLLTAAIVWRAGLKRYSAVGG